MDHFIAFPHSTIITGIILSAESQGSGPTLHDVVRIGHRGAVTYAVSIADPNLRQAASGALVPHVCRLVKQESEAEAYPILHSLFADPFEDGLLHVPELSCPRENVVPQIQQLVAKLDPPPLREFVRSVLLRRDVHSRFWTMPASARHHHSRAGGLAVHSLEVANDLAKHGELTPLERNLGIAGGLLHDIGKVWSYTEDMFLSEAGLAMGHEMLGAVRLEPELARLEEVWPDGAYVMRCLLSGHSRPRDNGSLPTSLLPRIRACDQRSCEREAFEPTARRRVAWKPREWKSCQPADDLDF